MHEVQSRLTFCRSNFKMKFVLFMLLHLAFSCCYGRNTKIGLLLTVNECCTFQSFENSVGAISIAVDALRSDGIWSENISFVWRHTVQANDGVSNVVDLVLDESVDAIFGSPSSYATKAAAHLTAQWNIPHISWAAASYEFTNKDIYTSFVRTRESISDWGFFVISLFKEFGWRHFAMLYNNIVDPCKFCADGILDAITTTSVSLSNSIKFGDTATENSEIDKYMVQLQRTSRIIYICVELTELRRYLIRACLVGMCNGEFVFIYPWYIIFTDDIIHKNDGYNDIAEKGFKHLLLITLAQWHGEGYEEVYKKFQRSVILRTSQPPWNNNDAILMNQTASGTAPALYDATYFYGLWLNYTSTRGLDPRNGRAMFEFTKGLSFQGATGPVIFGDNGDKLPLLWAWQFIGEKMAPVLVAEGRYGSVVSYELEWQTVDGTAPVDRPPCGFYGELCQTENNESQGLNAVAIAIVVPFCAVISSAIAIFFILRFKRKERDLQMRRVWKIDPSSIQMVDRRTAAMSKSSRIADLQSGGTFSLRSLDSQKTEIGSLNVNAAFYNGNFVMVKKLRNNINLSALDMKELEAMKEMHHVNINPFFGACFGQQISMAVFQFCPKGCLQGILENEDIILDDALTHSLINDLVQGLRYIHNSHLVCHGRLKSSNCVVDNKLTLKITDYGMTKFFDCDPGTNQTDAEKYKSLLWTAPEILIDPILYTKGSKLGDVYSVGIILHEIIFRMGVFAGWEDMTAEDVIRRVRNRERIPVRPVISEGKESEFNAPLIELMEVCWNDVPENRPTVADILRIVRNARKAGNEQNFTGIVQSRLMKYTENLEVIVNKRTQLLLEETRKTHELLYKMLPKSVADKLKVGMDVFPEEFESATVYFADIVGFTAIASESKPIEVVDFLNEFYTELDILISQYDVYKVETVGDCYLIVSGVPVRNGDDHVGIIADMALAIQGAAKSFTIPHLPTKELQLRSGFHTGPCCAGVIGLTMPKYCLFGDTVNTASRMESYGEAQRIHISQEAFFALTHIGAYRVEFRAELDVKGKGKMKTYWLLDKDQNLRRPVSSLKARDGTIQLGNMADCLTTSFLEV